jgi:glycosyltransferase involved in cell wall biosynthesis
MHVDQIVVGASGGDAVTESALRIRDALRQHVESDLFALHIDPRISDDVRHVIDFPRPQDRTADDVIVYHVSIGETLLNDFVLHRGERVVVVYHNITPAHFFRDVDQEFARLLDDGRRQLWALLGRAERVIADSAFNAEELRELGRDDVVATPPPLNLGRLVDVAPDAAMLDTIERTVPGKLVLFVGQLLPHKRPDLLLGAHHLLVANYASDTRLVIAGPNRNPRYRQALMRYVRELNLDTVWVTGELSDAQLAALYRRADAFVTASEHEGFCVPIVEAFHFGVPVVARAFGAIPETVGSAGLVLPSDSGARDLAEAVRRVLFDQHLHQILVQRGRARREVFSIDATLDGTMRVLHEVIASSREAIT